MAGNVAFTGMEPSDKLKSDFKVTEVNRYSCTGNQAIKISASLRLTMSKQTECKINFTAQLVTSMGSLGKNTSDRNR